MAGLLGDIQSKLGSYLATEYKPGDYGRMQGYLAAQEEKRATNKDNREERVLQMGEEEFSWKRDKVQHEKTLQAGMRAAAEDGGYEAVISYLEKADPERAMVFTDSKLDLDKKIMGNDIFKATADYKKQELLVESYGLLGKMGYALLNTPPEQRAQVYQQALPMIKKINPEAPDNVEAAAPMFLLAAAQATPANQLFRWGKEATKAQSNVGKINADILAAKERGASIDGEDEDSKGLQALYAEREKLKAHEIEAQNQLTKVQLGQTKDKLQATELLSNSLQKSSVINQKYIESYTAKAASLKTLTSDPTNPAAKNQLTRSFAKDMQGGGVMTEQDVMAAFGSAGYETLRKKVLSMMSGKEEVLNPVEIKDLSTMFNNIHNEKVNAQKSIESKFQNSIADFGTVVDWKNVRKPSEMFTEYLQQSSDASQAGSGQIPAALRAAAEDAIKRGADPQKVQERLQQKLQQLQQQDQETHKTPLTPEEYE